MSGFNPVVVMHSILVGYTPILVSYNTGLFIKNDVGISKVLLMVKLVGAFILNQVSVKSGLIIGVEVAQQALSLPSCFRIVEEEEMQTVWVEVHEVDLSKICLVGHYRVANIIVQLVVYSVRAFILKQGKSKGLINNPTFMSSSSSSSTVEVVLQSIDGKIFDVDEVVAKQSVMIEHLIENRLTSSSPVVIPSVCGNRLAKIIEYCKCVVTKPLSGENYVEPKAFVLGLVNDDEENLFRLFVAMDYLAIKGLLSLSCDEVLDLIKDKDSAHIRKILNITPEFSQEKEERTRIVILELSTK
ncbi:hypothetical protein M9H77_31299 [Catharanthus roseus]|uniref:Uncharacterized protein n=1 Tax=Catharanthus roseus TaxID=4058 RepID=A0ACC0A0Z4_CATRO|nr:hypothetical protein M9H77_31299 [Catharanthus roseus]